jgi:hypothetical protein
MGGDGKEHSLAEARGLLAAEFTFRRDPVPNRNSILKQAGLKK